ncbi:putative S-adenosyl-L-methionine-dependent methyltransferase-domain-containing protein [Sordaria brevicollis]|uniref:Protein arginine methyltransferase NDUFAF7 n=1 Tax=Sordaria brevicollis TaxID=83679 RepID=A0AAE0P248_SORBR|nr:putative S-adenosyl-L-methionine-dependent methyltransferase-domain-containing protein [Sordaria brevicollis]
MTRQVVTRALRSVPRATILSRTGPQSSFPRTPSFRNRAPPSSLTNYTSFTRNLSLSARRLKEEKEKKDDDDDDVEERKWSTPLAKQLAEAISATGPVPLASFMRMCLTGDIGGYYTGAIEKSDEQNRDQFGAAGDFVTSPEISQVFGELCGLWYVTEWMAQGRPSKGVELIEIGPGRGTLMDDMLRTIQNFPEMAKAIDAVYMVEASPQLRTTQKNLLCGEDAVMIESSSKAGYHSTCKYGNIPVVWTESIKSIPHDPEKTPFIMAHEFFDALPIHAFQLVEVPSIPPSSTPEDSPVSAITTSGPKQPKSPPGTTGPTLEWRELLVSPTPPGSTHSSLRTPPSHNPHLTPPPDFQLTLSPSPTRHSLHLPELSPRYRALKSSSSSRLPEGTPKGAGAIIEISPDTYLVSTSIATLIGGSSRHPKPSPRGAALILDYGPGDGSVPVNSLRGIRKHNLVSPFAEPGLTDLSADVDFEAIAEATTNASEGVEVHGPVEQGWLLQGLGGEQRVEMLAKSLKEKGAEKETEDLKKAWKRLVDRGPNGMGRVYKALAIVPENEGRRRPVGFGGDVVM